MNVLAIVPARGGSKRIPNKNIADCGGKPLIYWSIKSAQESKTVSRVVVSSDSEQILDMARVYGAEAVKRPASISGDTTRIEDSLLHVINEGMDWNHAQESIPEMVVTLQPTCPVRRPGLIDSCVFALKDHPRHNSLLTVRSVGITWWRQAGFDSMEWEWVNQFERRVIPQSQQWDLHHERFAEDGSVFGSRTSALLKTADRRTGPVWPYVTTGCVDIDTGADLEAASAQLRAREAVSA